MAISFVYNNHQNHSLIHMADFQIYSHFKIYIFMSGGETYQITDGSGINVLNGDILIIPPYTNYKFSGSVAEYCEINFEKGDISDKLYKELEEKFGAVKCIGIENRKKWLIFMAERFKGEANDDKNYKEIMCRSLLESLLVEIIRADKANKRVDVNSDVHAVMNVMEYINENYNKKLTLYEMSKIACMSPSQFGRKFKQHAGVSPTDYLAKTRINAAIKLICDASLTTSQIAERVGMSGASYFCSQFKKYTGATPREYGKILDADIKVLSNEKE